MEKGFLRKVIGCSKCGENKYTLYRVKDEKGEKVKPPKYVCGKCR